MAQPETRLVERMKRAILARWPDAFVVKLHGNPYQSAGLPDLLVVLRGRVVGVEAKAPRIGESREHALGRVTLRQRAVLDRIEKAGGVTGVALTVDEAVDIVSRAERT